MRRRLLSEYPLSLLSGYLAMAAGIIAQVVLVPVYLKTLGADGIWSPRVDAGDDQLRDGRRRLAQRGLATHSGRGLWNQK